MMNEWIEIEKKLPPLSYEDLGDRLGERYDVLVHSSTEPGVHCIAYLVKDEDSQYNWEINIPCFYGSGGQLIKDIPLNSFSHWKPIRSPMEF